MLTILIRKSPLRYIYIECATVRQVAIPKKSPKSLAILRTSMYACFVRELNKDLMASSLGPMILLVLKRQESYGYEIIQQLKDKTGGQLSVAEGTLYPVLKKMEEKEWIQGEWKKADNGRERRYYSITAKGGQELEEQISQWTFINNLIHNLWQPPISTQMIR